MKAYGLTCWGCKGLGSFSTLTALILVFVYIYIFPQQLFSLILKAVGIFSVWIILISQLFAYAAALI